MVCAFGWSAAFLDRASPVSSFFLTSYPSPGVGASPPRAALWTSRWQLPASPSARRVCLREYAPSPRARILRLESMALCLPPYPFERVRLFLFLAYLKLTRLEMRSDGF